MNTKNKTSGAANDAVSEELAELRQLVEHYRGEVEALRANRGETEQDPFDGVMLHEDPYSNHHAFKIIGDIEPCAEYPNGAKVSWVNPLHRERRMWRGWIPFEWGDEYTGPNGELLDKYVLDPPRMLQGPDKIDNYVRRADSVLARIDMSLWQARQANRINKSRRNAGTAGSAKTTVLAEGVEIVGSGTKDSHRPRGGFRPTRESLPPPAEGVERRVYSGPTRAADSED